MVRVFFVVTLNSAYRVSDGSRTREKMPFVLRVAARSPENFVIAVISEDRKLGNFVGVSTCAGNTLVVYNYAKREFPDMVNTWCWKFTSSPIVGIFLRKKFAMNCFAWGNTKSADERWQIETTEALAAIGSDHPVFVMPKQLYPWQT